jgi:hypothetical protein
MPSGGARRALRQLVRTRPASETLVGLVAIVFGLALFVVVLIGKGLTHEALLPLVFVLYGVVHIAVFTDLRKRMRRRLP